MEKLITLEAVAAALPFDNLDTDQLMPKQFLRGIDKSGLAKGMLYNMRHLADGSVNPEFVLNRPGWEATKILVAGPNFGCGSSREHAVWGLMQYGIRAVIAPSFADIFYNNSLKNGLLPVVLPELVIDRLFDACNANAGYKLTVDLDRQLVIEPDGTSTPFEVAAFRRWALMNGYDDIGITLSTRQDKIRAFEQQRLAQKPWLNAVLEK